MFDMTDTATAAPIEIQPPAANGRNVPDVPRATPKPKHADPEIFDEVEPARPFAVRNPATAEVTTYWIHPFAEGTGLKQWLEVCDTSIKADDNGRVTERDTDALHLGCIGLCLRTGPNPGAAFVGRDVFGKWGTRARLNCYMRCRDINGLDDADKVGKG